ncbi:MAG TPA: ArsR family transcriptional regulator [Anaerolineales bacterium]|nr:ArsR family transcriptional regulator [Anaerolineales bacterium]
MPPVASDSRQRIVEVLKRRGEASVADLSQALGLTPVTIRHHLDGLLEAQVVSEPSPRKKPGPGRPEMVYSLTHRAEEFTPRNYGELCLCLLEALADTPVDAHWVLTTAGDYLPARAVHLSKTPKMDDSLAFLEARGYFPSLEPGERPAIILANCPYLEVARAYPHVCEFDRALIGRLVGAPVVAEASIARDDPTCRLRLPFGVPV